MVAAPVLALVLPVGEARAQDGEADGHDGQAGRQVQPRVEPVGDDPLRERERDEPEREDADRVRHGHDQPEQGGVARRAALADEVGADDRLAVAG